MDPRGRLTVMPLWGPERFSSPQSQSGSPGRWGWAQTFAFPCWSQLLGSAGWAPGPYSHLPSLLTFLQTLDLLVRGRGRKKSPPQPPTQQVYIV